MRPGEDRFLDGLVPFCDCDVDRAPVIHLFLSRPCQFRMGYADLMMLCNRRPVSAHEEPMGASPDASRTPAYDGWHLGAPVLITTPSRRRRTGLSRAVRQDLCTGPDLRRDRLTVTW